ncbi:hypothetical protein CSKR_104390 [Clonorchis sinensis]|uniref:Uncharacterized protein n=1 Tax=Clonorchis sinensis TaxID=79923 RepID=A0A419PLG4_CLOSI|nr:hypothetical protein CSKR_104390 [Clonorchis sinensis]
MFYLNPIGNIKNGRFSYVPGKSLAKPKFYPLTNAKTKETPYIRNSLLIRLLKILRQPTTGFALLLWAHQCITYIHVSRYLEYRSNWNMRRSGAARSVAWKHQKREIQLGFR